MEYLCGFMTYEGYQDYFRKKLIISVAITGGHHGKETNPNLPEQPDEIAQDVKKCEDSGASIVHIHARDDEGNPTKNPDRFQQVLDSIRYYCDDILINFTTGGGGIHTDENTDNPKWIFTPDERIAPLLETSPPPDLATIDLGPLNTGRTRTAINPRAQNERFAHLMKERRIKPELEIFNQGHLTELNYLIDNDMINPPYWCTLILGMQTGTPPNPSNLLNFVENIPENTVWQTLAIGKHQLPLTTLSIILGGHVRVGLEDNVYYKKGELARSNAQLVERIVRIAKELERPIASPSEVRSILDI